MNGTASIDAGALFLTNTTFADTECVVVEAHDALFEVVRTVHGAASSTDLVHTATPYGVLAASLVLCLCGFYALRFVVGVAAFSAGLVGSVRMLQLGGTALAEGGHTLAVSCDVATVVVLLGGGISALVAVFMTKVLSTLLGAVASGVVVGAVFAACGDVCNADLWAEAPRLLGMSLVPFWGAMLLATSLGAIVARKRHREMLATVAALIGGFGVALSVRSLVDAHATLPNWGFLCIVGAVKRLRYLVFLGKVNASSLFNSIVALELVQHSLSTYCF